MYKFILGFSRLGKIRISRYFDTLQSEPLSKKNKLSFDVMQLVLARSRTLSNIVEFKEWKIVYKRYASLYFAICCTQDCNELLVLEIIHRFVQGLDQIFGNVSELDILYGMQVAYTVLDELFIAGQFQEPSLKRLVKIYKGLEERVKEEQLKENLGFVNG